MIICGMPDSTLSWVLLVFKMPDLENWCYFGLIFSIMNHGILLSYYNSDENYSLVDKTGCR